MDDPAEPRIRHVREIAEVGQSGTQLVLVRSEQLHERGERTLHHLGGVARLMGEVAVPKRVRTLALVDVAEAARGFGASGYPGLARRRQVAIASRPSASVGMTESTR